jgi:hypothetical protein
MVIDASVRSRWIQAIAIVGVIVLVVHNYRSRLREWSFGVPSGGLSSTSGDEIAQSESQKST